MPDREGPIWTPKRERADASQMSAFRRRIALRRGEAVEDSRALQSWSVENRAAFWREIWSFCDIIGEAGDTTLVDGERMPGAKWFPNARLNFAENLLRRRDENTAIVFRSESGPRRELSFAELTDAVARFAQALVGFGIEPGDRVAGMLPNLPEAIVAMLATSSLGAVWSSCSPDFGLQGVLDRFGQVEPRVLLLADGYGYGGKRFDGLTRAAELAAELGSVEQIVIVPHLRESPEISGIRNAHAWPQLLAAQRGGEPEFRRLGFDHPLAILYSSGTTGPPKCIVHGAGGTLLQHAKEHRLHVDLGPQDRFFYFTTCGWMMWNWLASGLAAGATLVLYDGSPFHPDGNLLFDLAQQERVSVFGTSAKFLDAAAKAGLEPARTHDLASLRTILSTGSPLLPEGFDYVYEKIKPEVHLASISGGTDIVSCFVLGDPTQPVFRGEIQAAGLGMDVRVFDDRGKAVLEEKGELVCTQPFPSMPVGFWKDPDGARYREAYFERFPGVWCHGDYTLESSRGGFVIYGRSDAVLNPGGVRIGTAEIYRTVEALPEVVEAIAIGQQWQGDVRVVLFVVLRDGRELDEALGARIRAELRQQTTPRHVPARIAQVPDIPRTRSGKITELAVRDVVHGKPVQNVEALANPEALEHFRNRSELDS
jgi:acetoacetyl-CoA synthetase